MIRMTRTTPARASLILLFVLQGLPPTALHAQNTGGQPFAEETSKQDNIYRSRENDRPAGYVINRDLEAYANALPPQFNRTLSALRAPDRWLDIGAGEGQAILDYYDTNQVSPHDKMAPQSRATGS
jgi:hypothetical protein